MPLLTVQVNLVKKKYTTCLTSTDFTYTENNFSSLEIMYDRAEANSNKLEESVLLLEQWKRRGDDLLYSMLPRQVAEHLRQGKDPITTCQVSFDRKDKPRSQTDAKQRRYHD